MQGSLVVNICVVLFSAQAPGTVVVLSYTHGVLGVARPECT